MSEGITPEQQAEIDKKWAELEKSFNDAKVHPVCPKMLFVLLTDDGVGWRKEWTKPMVERWWKFLDGTFEDKSHKKAVEDLIYLTAFVHHNLERVELAVGMLVLLNEAVLKYKLVDINVDGKFEAAVDERAKQQVTGASARPVPAKVGDKAPEGSLRPDQLGKGPRRI